MVRMEMVQIKNSNDTHLYEQAVLLVSIGMLQAESNMSSRVLRYFARRLAFFFS